MSPILPLTDTFAIPLNADIGASSRSDLDSRCIYLCGNSLGPLSSNSKKLINQELDAWASLAVVAHFSHPENRPWTEYCDYINPLLAELIGAKEGEVACMSTLTANLHLMMDSFYKPTPTRYKILCEAKAFPSDQYAFQSQAKAHGLNPQDAVLEISPREGEYILRESDILDIIEKEGDSIALVLLSGIQYYTGQWFPMQSITKKAKEKGCVCGWDLAHAIGNVPLSLHDWDVDFAVFCTYKYLNSGPGGIAGLFMHEKWNKVELPKFAGWWGHKLSTRFDMPPTFEPIHGAQGFQQSNPSVLGLASLLGSLQVFKQAGMMPRLREQSLRLTATLEQLLLKSPFYVPLSEVHKKYSEPGVGGDKPGFTIITPNDPSSRGAQLSLLFLPVASGVMKKVFDALTTYGVIGDEREPDVIRLAPIPLYNSIKDCEDAARYLDRALQGLIPNHS